MRFLLLLGFFTLIPTLSYSQKVFSVDYSNQSYLKVFVVKYENQCDLKVFSTCDLSVMMSAPNIANLYCNNTCSAICRLVSGWSGFGSADNGGGGVYIVASSVNYLN